MRRRNRPRVTGKKEKNVFLYLTRQGRGTTHVHIQKPKETHSIAGTPAHPGGRPFTLMDVQGTVCLCTSSLEITHGR